jgi:hypothetical protein
MSKTPKGAKPKPTNLKTTEARAATENPAAAPKRKKASA